MDYKPSDVAKRLAALLRNARMLAVHHQQRPFASDVVKVCKIIAASSNFPIDEGILDKLMQYIPGKMSGELNDAFAEAVEAVKTADVKAHWKAVKPDGLLTWSDLA
jgi:hypothetical protein